MVSKDGPISPEEEDFNKGRLGKGFASFLTRVRLH